MNPYFIWKNFNSLDKNIMVNKLPNFERPDANIEKIIITGRDGYLTQDDGTYKGMIKPCECSLDDGNIDDVCSWLTGSGEIIFSNEPDKKYKAVIINKIPFSKIIPTFHTFIIQFECQPHKYSVGNEVIELTNQGTLYNYGTKYSKPVVKIYGNGSINLTINSKTINLTNITDSITIDSDLLEAYNDIELLNSHMVGEFPVFEVGENIISWTGTVTKLDIIPNWRWI